MVCPFEVCGSMACAWESEERQEKGRQVSNLSVSVDKNSLLLILQEVFIVLEN